MLVNRTVHSNGFNFYWESNVSYEYFIEQQILASVTR